MMLKDIPTLQIIPPRIPTRCRRAVPFVK